MIGITAFCPNESPSAERLSYVGDVAPSTRIRGNELSYCNAPSLQQQVDTRTHSGNTPVVSPMTILTKRIL